MGGRDKSDIIVQIAVFCNSVWIIWARVGGILPTHFSTDLIEQLCLHFHSASRRHRRSRRTHDAAVVPPNYGDNSS